MRQLVNQSGEHCPPPPKIRGRGNRDLLLVAVRHPVRQPTAFVCSRRRLVLETGALPAVPRRDNTGTGNPGVSIDDDATPENGKKPMAPGFVKSPLLCTASTTFRPLSSCLTEPRRSQLRHGRAPGQAPPVSPQSFLPVKPLSDDEFGQLADFLEARSPFDTDGLLGVLNAIAVAPSLPPPSAWLPVVLPNGLGDLGKAEAEKFIGLLFRLYGDVLDALEHRQAVMPGPEDVAGCRSFAAGYAAGAEIDPEWLGNADHWTFAAPMAYLGGRLDLVSQTTVDDIQLNFAPDPEAILCRQMGALIRASHESFTEVRRKALPQMVPARGPGSSRVGRNQPCPCGSGKKFKRCCIDSEPQVDAG